ncbi:hypothetical protein BDB01DRAFT_776184 [Pilobolus umbonatus]|nr:hypothetical protein BDB01DRAFT_776184 [Pilobolus umbonatus]
MLPRHFNHKAFSIIKCYVSLLNLTPTRYTHPAPFLPIVPRRPVTTASPAVDIQPDKPLQHVKKIYKKFRTVPCSGFAISNGSPCRKLVKVSKSNVNDNQPAYCCNHKPSSNYDKKKHAKELLKITSKLVPITEQAPKNTTPFKPPDKIYDCWTLWIGDHLNSKNKKLILKEMKKPISEHDKPGYIYVYSISEGPRISSDTFAYFKIGRTIDPHKRMYQVVQSCQHEPKIIELFPSFPDKDQPVNGKSVDGHYVMSTNLDTLNHTIQNLPKCPLSHRVERLIHLELSSLYPSANFLCPVCNTRHREWIKVRRLQNAKGRPMTDQELMNSCLRPIILRWIQYGVAISNYVN